MDIFQNPFTPGAGSLPPELAGRNAIIEEGNVLAARVAAGRNDRGLMLVGLRGVGKTVLLKHLAESARSHGVVPIVLEVRNDRHDIEDLSIKLKDALSALDFKSKVKTGVNYALSVLRNFVKSVSVNIGDFGVSMEVGENVGNSGSIEYDLSEVLKSAARAAKEAGTAIGLYIDEVQNLEPALLRGIIVAMHHSNQDLLPLYFVGSGLPSVKALVGKSKTYAERMFVYEDVGALDRQSATDAIAIPMLKGGVTVEKSAADMIFTNSLGYPFFLQEFGFRLWNQVEKTSIGKEDVKGVLPRVRESMDKNFFSVRFDRVSNLERRFLKAMHEVAVGGVSEIAKTAELLGKTQASISPVRASLIKKGMVYSPALGKVAYTVPMFGEYVCRVMS